ncbi:MAG: hypothetical protein JW808_04005, partial [Victivallales bacterium]|nr:hypothetical protein [Victivallales bacterium]
AFYAELININAFHQPGVEAYKNESKVIISLLRQVIGKLPSLTQRQGSAAQLAEAAGFSEKLEDFEGILAKFASNPGRPGNTVSRTWCSDKNEWIYRLSK